MRSSVTQFVATLGHALLGACRDLAPLIAVIGLFSASRFTAAFTGLAACFERAEAAPDTFLLAGEIRDGY